MFSFPVYYSRIESSFSSVVLLIDRLGELTPRFICPRRLVCSFSSLVEKTLSVPGKSRKPRYQPDLVCGERGAFIRLTRSICEVTSVLVPIRVSVPRIDKRVSVQTWFRRSSSFVTDHISLSNQKTRDGPVVDRLPQAARDQRIAQAMVL
jgi:hypothetical protein